MDRLSWDNLLAWRVQRQHLQRRAPRAGALDVATDLGGLHAQLLSSAELTLWARVDRPQEGAARALWEERALVKTWAMRGTLHLLPSAEYATWQAALDTRRDYLKPVWLRYYGLTPATLEALLEAISRALEGPPLTREELASAVARLTGKAHLAAQLRGSWGSLLKPAAFQGRLCFAPTSGPNVRFTRPDRWLSAPAPPGAPHPEGSRVERAPASDPGRGGNGAPAEVKGTAPVDPQEALRHVTRRYLTAYGPATREELARWWGTTPPRAGAMLAALGEEVVRVQVEGAPEKGPPSWMLAQDVAAATAATPGGVVSLLPAFDQYVVAAPRDAPTVLPAPFKGRVYRPQGWLSPVLLVDGRMAGVWRHERRGARLAVTVEPFAPLSGAVQRKVAAEARRLAGTLGGALDLTLA